jgi:hypothetical protein
MAAFAALDFIFLRAPQQTPRTHSFQGDPEPADLNVPYPRLGRWDPVRTRGGRAYP